LIGKKGTGKIKVKNRTILQNPFTPLFLVGAVFLLSSASFVLFAEADREGDVDLLIRQGVHHTVKHEYDGALACYRRITEIDPQGPTGYFYQAAVLQSRMMDLEIQDDEKEFYRLVDRTIRLARARLDRNSGDAEAYFYLGGAYGYKAFYQLRKREWLPAFSNSIKGISVLQKCLTIDPEYYDCYAGLGTYKYWRSQKLEFINWLPIVKDERELGIRLLEQAIQRGKYSKYAGISSLGWILMDYGRLDQAIATLEEGLKDYPDSRHFLWGLAKAYRKKGSIPRSNQIYRQILGSVRGEKINNHFNEISCHEMIASGLYELKEYDDALRECQQALSYSLDRRIERMARGKIEHIRRIMAECERRLYAEAR